MIRLFYWKDKPNVGDYYAYWLARKLYTNVEYSNRPNLIITGSILGWHPLSNDTIVWGAGLHNNSTTEFCRISNKANFIAVRGTLTADRLNLKNIVIGDPGLLASKYFSVKTPQIKKQYCILTHWKDYEKVKEKYGKYIDVINMATINVEDILTKINSYNLVLSTSLHGLIFAHSYGIPALYVEANEPESKNYFKFKDYYSALDIKFKQYKLSYNWTKDKSYFSTLNPNELVPTKECITTIQNNLLNCLPTENFINKKYNTVICAIAKNENKYINDWVNYHLSIGFEHIYLFDNNSNKDTWVGKVLNQLDKVTIFNINDIKKEGLQLDCYNWFYNNYSHNFNWVSFIDIDEFIFGITDINKFIAQKKFDTFEMIRLKWRLFGDDDMITRDLAIPVYKAIKKEIKNNELSNQAKCFIRGGLINICIGSCHYAYRNGPTNFNDLKARDMSKAIPLKECLPSGVQIKDKINITADYSTETIFINHYMTKTISEYLEQKYNRGDACFEKRNLKLDYFWAINKKTPEKLKFIEQFLHLDKPRPTPDNNANKKQKVNTQSTYLYF